MYADRVYYESSLIESTKYDHEHHELEVVFHGGKARVFTEVPSAKAEALESRKEGPIDNVSAGSYFKEHIDGVCPRKKE
jgi:hypothetical protein